MQACPNGASQPSSPHPPDQTAAVHARALEHGQASDGTAGRRGTLGSVCRGRTTGSRHVDGWPPGLMSRIIVAASPCSASDQRVWVLGGWTSALNVRALARP